MQRLENILIAVDLRHEDRLVDEHLSSASRAAVQQGLEVAGRAQAAVTFCSVLEISEQALELIREDEKNRFATVEDFARQALQKLVQEAAAKGIQAAYALRTGSTWDQLLEQIDQQKHDLVVIGTRERSSLVRTVFGSTAQRLLRSASCPVWIVKPEELRDIREVVVATDMTEACQVALHAAVDVARLLQAKLFVVHTLEFPFEAYLHTAGLTNEEVLAHRSKLRTDAQSKIETQLAKTDCRTLPFGVKIEILEGSPDEVLPKFLGENEIDLLIVGSRAHRGLSRWILGNTAERLLPHVHASVLTIPME
jgi:universal stress protein E